MEFNVEAAFKSSSVEFDGDMMHPIFYGVALVVVIALVLGGLWWRWKQGQLDRRVLAFAAQELLEPGTTTTISIPPPLRRTSRDGQVHVARLRDRNTCILLKKKIGYKDNFEGTLHCTRPFSTSEIIENEVSSRSYISLTGHGIFEELYIRRRVSLDVIRVYFDLH